MTTTNSKTRGVGRAGSFRRGATGDRMHAQALTAMGYPARPRPQASGLGRLQAAEVRRLTQSYGCTPAEAMELMRTSGSLPTAPTDIECAILEPIAHLESKFYLQPQWTRRAVMAEWRAQVHADARPYQLPVVIHSWSYCREPLVIVFPRRARWHMYTLGEWIAHLEEAGVIERDQHGRQVMDPDTGWARRVWPRPVAGAGTPDKQQAMLGVHPSARLDAARWARDAGGDYVAGAAAAAKQRQAWVEWIHSPEGQRAWLDHGDAVAAAGLPTVDPLDEVAVGGRLFTLGNLRPVLWEMPAGLELELVPAKGAPSGGLAPDGARDYGRRRAVRVRGDFMYDTEDFTLFRDADGFVQRDESGALCWRLDPTARPVAAVSALEWLA
ncbi:hypothetical protein [Deinococcus yunweiensis]|uniref:hypothetical protein n=1 Tax=Deinococcus yunweiensis TaxID=367282 RepID=UPI00398E46F7